MFMDTKQSKVNKEETKEEKKKTVPNLFELNKLKSATNPFNNQRFGNIRNQVKGGMQFRINQHKGA